MIKILQINTVAVHGSTGRITEGIGNAAIKRGFDSYIAYGRGKEPISSSKLIRIGSLIDVLIHILMTRLFDRQGLASYFSTKRFIKQIKTIEPSLIHIHNIHGNYLNFKVLFDFLSQSNIPVVWTMHDCWPITGHCVHYYAVNCSKWKSACESCPRLSSYPKSIWLDRSKKNFIDKKRFFTSIKNMHVVSVSSWLENVLRSSYLCKYDITRIHNGIDVEHFYPRTTEVSWIKEKYGLNDKFVILGVAIGWSSENGLFDFYQLRSKLSDNYAIVLVGVTPHLQKQLPKGIIGIPRTNSINELAMLYSSADVFINGSREETFGLVTAEAMACGTPVIVYNSTACAEIVTPEVGYVSEAGDLQGIINCIKKHENLSNEEKINMSNSCATYVRTMFDKDKKYKEYIDLYERVLGEDYNR